MYYSEISLRVLFAGLALSSLGLICLTPHAFAQASPCLSANLAVSQVKILNPVNQAFSLDCINDGQIQYQQDLRFSFFHPNQSINNILYVKTPNASIKDDPSLSWSIETSQPSNIFLFFRRIPGIPPVLPAWAKGYTRLSPDGYSDLSQFLMRKNQENGLIGIYDVWKSGLIPATAKVNFGPASDYVSLHPAYSMYIVGIVANAASAGHKLITSGVVYNADSSANSSRSRNTNIQLPENVVSSVQGWVAVRLRMGFPSTTTLTPDPNIFDMSESDAKSHFVYFDAGSDTFHFERTHAATVASPKQSFVAGAVKTIIATWSTSQIKISVDGAAFSTLNNSDVIAQRPLSFGSSQVQGALRQPNSDYFWAAGGNAFLSDSQALAIHNFGNTDHPAIDFPANTTFLWDAQSDIYN